MKCFMLTLTLILLVSFGGLGISAELNTMTTTTVAAHTELVLGAGDFRLAPGVQILLGESSVLRGVRPRNGTAIDGDVCGDAVVKTISYNTSLYDVRITNWSSCPGSSALKLDQFGVDAARISLVGHYYGLQMFGAYYAKLDHFAVEGPNVVAVSINGSNSATLIGLGVNGGQVGVDVEGQTVALHFVGLSIENTSEHGLLVGAKPGGAFLVNVFGAYCENQGISDCLFEGLYARDTYSYLQASGVQDIGDTGCHGSWTITSSHMSGCNSAFPWNL